MLKLDPNENRWRRKLKDKGLASFAELLVSMLNTVASQRPSPSSILAFCGGAAPVAVMPSSTRQQSTNVERCSGFNLEGTSASAAPRTDAADARMKQGLRS